MATYEYNTHPLPPSKPGTPNDQPRHEHQSQYRPQYPHDYQQPPAQKPQAQTRKSRSFSFRSDKSHTSAGKHKTEKTDLHETSAEKEAKRLHSKADPSMAINEAEPSEVAANLKSSLAPLRNMLHKDAHGHPIEEPDLSNPTRSRWERPLDTIRSFEASIDGGYSSRKSYIRSDTDSVAWGNNRRSSYYANGPGGRFPHDSYYGGGSRPASVYPVRPDSSQYDLRQGARDSFPDQQQSGYNLGSPGHSNGRRAHPRISSEPQFHTGHWQPLNEYGMPNIRGYENTNSPSGSGTSAEQADYQTDPTSDNSSVERMPPPPKCEPVNDYGIGFTQSTAYQPPTFAVASKVSSASSGSPDYITGSLPVPVHGSPAAGKATPAAFIPRRPAEPEKRKSWFARRFSKQSVH